MQNHLTIRNLRLYFLFVALFALCACAGGAKPLSSSPAEGAKHQQVMPTLENGGGLLLDTGGRVSATALADFFKGYDYILLGETHNQMADHLAQAHIIEVMAGAGLKPVLGLEMVAVTRDEVLQKFNADKKMPLDKLKEALEWDKSVGYSFELYRPVFKAARAHGLSLHALNTPRMVVREARLKGLDGVSALNRRFLPKDMVDAHPEQRKKLKAVFSMHMKSASGAALEGFILAQSIWDSYMAEQAVNLKNKYKQPVVIIVGQGHVEFGWGIARRLARYDSAGRTLSLIPWRGGERPPLGQADAYFYAPFEHSFARRPAAMGK